MNYARLIALAFAFSVMPPDRHASFLFTFETKSECQDERDRVAAKMEQYGYVVTNCYIHKDDGDKVPV